MEKIEDDGEVSVAVGKDFNRQMLKLQKSVDRNAQVVGWCVTVVPSKPSICHRFASVVGMVLLLTAYRSPHHLHSSTNSTVASATLQNPST